MVDAHWLAHAAGNWGKKGRGELVNVPVARRGILTDWYLGIDCAATVAASTATSDVAVSLNILVYEYRTITRTEKVGIAEARRHPQRQPMARMWPHIYQEMSGGGTGCSNGSRQIREAFLGLGGIEQQGEMRGSLALTRRE